MEQNFSFFPILIEPDFPITRDQLYEALKARGIHPRRYFYPLISEHPVYRHLPSARPDILPVAWSVARKNLCLPIYPELQIDVVEEIAAFISLQ